VQQAEATPVKVAAVQQPPQEEVRGDGEHPRDKGRDKDREKAEAIATALAELDVQVLGALGQSENVGILSSSEVPEGMLEEAARSSAGGAAGLRAGGGGGVAQAGGGSLSAIGGTGGGSAGAAVGGAPSVRGEATIGPVTVNNGTLTDADAVVGRYRSMFRRCYEHALRTDPSQHGSLVVELDVLTTGRVDNARTAVRQGIDHDVAQCIEQRAQSMRFSAPSSEVTLAFQVTFAPRPAGQRTK
jgi:hypothetical protein